jgi:hypothetical protein
MLQLTVRGQPDGRFLPFLYLLPDPVDTLNIIPPTDCHFTSLICLLLCFVSSLDGSCVRLLCPVPSRLRNLSWVYSWPSSFMLLGVALALLL